MNLPVITGQPEVPEAEFESVVRMSVVVSPRPSRTLAHGTRGIEEVPGDRRAGMRACPLNAEPARQGRYGGDALLAVAAVLAILVLWFGSPSP